MGLRSFMKNVKHVLRMVEKPSRSDYWLLLRVSILGIAAIGLYGFMIMYLSTVISAAFP